MKVRNDFITNSSSSCFVISMKRIASIDEIKKSLSRHSEAITFKDEIWDEDCFSEEERNEFRQYKKVTNDVIFEVVARYLKEYVCGDKMKITHKGYDKCFIICDSYYSSILQQFLIGCNDIKTEALKIIRI